ncbi:MAG: ABC transporter permease [Fuerstiella sp.]|nr:ABC transporter permease [Fuerstiella sp.]
MSDGSVAAAEDKSAHTPDARDVTLSNTAFMISLGIIGGTYVSFILAMLFADTWYMAEKSVKAADAAHSWTKLLIENPIAAALSDQKIRYSIRLSLISCTLSAVFSLLVAVPIGYLLSRHQFRGKRLLDAVLDIPIVLPPLVVGLSLLILFQYRPFAWIARDVVYQLPAVVLAQFSVACAFAVRTMKSTFDHINPRSEQVAVTLGCSRAQAFGAVVLPEASRGMMTAFTLAWARSLGEFGPLLIFAGATRMKTEVLSTSVFLELNVGNIEAAVAVSLIMILAAVTVLVITRRWGLRDVTL